MPTSSPCHGSDRVFYWCLSLLGGTYILLIVAMLIADVAYTSSQHFLAALAKREIRYAVMLSLISCSLTAILSLWVGVPLGYLLSRTNFRGKAVVDTLLDIPAARQPKATG